MSRNEDRWGDCVGHPYLNYKFFLCDRGKIVRMSRAEAACSRGIWTMDTERGYLCVYVTCFTCGWANNISNHNIRRSTGRVADECVVCPKCHVHFFPQLVGWRSSFSERIGWHVVQQKKGV